MISSVNSSRVAPPFNKFLFSDYVVSGALPTLIPFLKEIAVFLAVVCRLLLSAPARFEMDAATEECLDDIKIGGCRKFYISLNMLGPFCAHLEAYDEVSTNNLLDLMRLLSSIVIECETPASASVSGHDEKKMAL